MSTLGLVLVILLIVVLLGGLPQVGLHEAGYAPSSVIAVVLVIVLVLLLMGKL